MPDNIVSLNLPLTTLSKTQVDMARKKKEDQEEWVLVNELNGDPLLHHYKISNKGRVIKVKKGKGEGELFHPKNIGGYPYISLTTLNKYRESVYLHRLVAQLFVEPRNENCIFVIHKDYDRGNNAADNLEWVTRRELYDHRKKNPRRPKINYNAYKLNEKKVREIKKLLQDENIRLKDIANKFGITHTQLNRIRSGENWGHVKL